MRLTTLAFTVLSLALAGSGCGEKGARRPGVDPAPEAQAPAAIGASFLVEQAGDALEANRARIAIAKDSLGREFLLQSGLTVMPFLGTSNGNLSRIVTFRVIDGSLWMFDAAQGKIATADIPQTFVLAKFPIKSQTRNHIYFDFNAGMSELFVGEEWRASDFSGTDVKPDMNAIKLSLSYLEAASISSANELVVRQIAQVDMPKGTVAADASGATAINYQQDHTSIEVRYYLTPYAPAADFVSTESQGFDTYGYFEVAPRYDDEGVPVINATKFANGPITFAISANTPPEVRDAVRDGILYWNKAFGEERVSAVDAPAGVTAPDFNYNVIQWVKWDDAGFAYADAQADPRTGQTMHAQVYLTSVFYVLGLERAKSWLDRVGALSGGGTTPTARPASVGLRGFQGGHLCLADMTKDFTALVQELVVDGADDAKIQKVTLDYIRVVVAHEVGHTLGLRHNFAGSLAANFPVSELETVFRDYAVNARAPADKVTSNSVMEYQTFLNSTITGDKLVTGTSAMPYDRQAILNLYASLPADATPQAFCTDSLESVFADCKTFDEGRVVSDSLVRALKAAGRLLGQTTPVGTDAVPVAYFIDANTVADSLLAPTIEAAALVQGSAKLLDVRQGLGLPSTLEPVFEAQERDTLLQQITASGGFDAIIPLTTILPDPILPVLQPAKDNLELTMTSKLLDILAQPTRIVDHGLGQAFAAHLEKATRLVAMTETATPISVTVTRAGAPVVLSLPQFKNTAELRVKAVQLLKPGRGESPAFGLTEALRVKGELKTRLDTAFGADVATADLATLPADAQRWVAENRAVLEAFGR